MSNTEPTEPTVDDSPDQTQTAPSDTAAEVEKWKSLARQNEKQAKANAEAAQRLAEIEEAQNTAEQKQAEALAAAQQQAAQAQQDALKLNVAISEAPEGMTPQQVAELAGRLNGSTVEELKADAEVFFKQFQTPPSRPDNRSLPTPALRLGATPTDDASDSNPLLEALKAV